VTVSDGDTIRFLHTPTPWHPKALRKGEKASELAMPIRICTIDTPETPKFGKPGQPFGMEAKQALTDLVTGKPIRVGILQMDQYGRAVADVQVPRGPFRKPLHVDAYMLQHGWAEVYTGGGAVYGPEGLDTYIGLQEEAKSKKLGIWSKGKRESAAEYKRRTKN
jgi:endonuclease YncB( thermonuclease family)